MSVGKNVTKDPTAADLATLTRRVADLERQLRQVPSRFPANFSEPATVRVDQVAHGITPGQVVVRGQAGWSVFNPFVFFQVLSQDPAWTGALVGIVENTYGPDALLVRLSGQFVGGWTFLDAGNTEAPVAGAKLYAKELAAGLGELTHVPQPSGVVVGYMLDATTMIVEPFRDSDAVVVSLTGALVSGQPTAVKLSTGAAAVASTVGASTTDQVGVAYYEAAGSILVAISGSIRTDALTMSWAEGNLWLDPATAGNGVVTKPVPPTPAVWRPTLFARQLNNRLTVRYGHFSAGVSDAWDADFTTPPADGEVLKWNNTDKRWRPGTAGLATTADGPSVIARQVAGIGAVTAFQTTANEQVLYRTGGILVWDKINLAQMYNRTAYTTVANVGASSGALTEVTAADGTVFGRKGSVMGFGSDPELGTAAGGLGYFKIHFAASKYWELNASGVMTVYQSATSKVEILADSSMKFTWGSSNTLTIDPADVVGTSRSFKIREIDVCDSSGVAKKIQLICTAMY
jgi:hypothetical protein